MSRPAPGARRPPSVVALVFVLALSASVLARQDLAGQSVRGEIVDAVTGVPVVGAEVAIFDQFERLVLLRETNEVGRFELLAPESGSYVLRVTRLGYATFSSAALLLARRAPLDVRVRLGVDAIPLEPLTVITRGRPLSSKLAGFERRRTNPSLSGIFMTSEDIERRPAATPTQFLRVVPGVTLQPIASPEGRPGLDRSHIYFPGARGGEVRPQECLAQVFVDGVRMNQSEGNSIDDMLGGVPMAGIEAYPRAAAAPIEYRGTGECGVVLFWTADPQASGLGWNWRRLLAGAATMGLMFYVGFGR